MQWVLIYVDILARKKVNINVKKIINLRKICKQNNKGEEGNIKYTILWVYRIELL